MKKKILKKNIVILIIISVVAIWGCKKDELEKSNTINTKVQTEEVIVKEGILSFKDRKSFDQIYPKLVTMSGEESETWENKLGFISQRSIFNKVVDAEIAWDKKCQNLSKEEQKTVLRHSDLYYKYIKSGLFEITDKGTSDETYNYSVYNPTYTCVLNEKGVLIINDTIYQLTNDKLKIITDGNKEKIKDLSNTDFSNNNHIIVYDMQKYKIKSKGIFNWYGSSGWKYNGNRRLLIGWGFGSDLLGGGTNCNVIYNVNVQCQEKNWLGNWNYSFINTLISSNWNARFVLMDNTKLDYNPSFAYYGSINNFWASINPTVSNSTSPYPSSFTYYAPSGNNFWYELQVYNANWTAIDAAGTTANCYH